ncbi:MAG TPA: isocitrate lyase/phosphoenolpyruvate mutase family protein [Acidimicrobiales bacterium]|nr:isocitrate lyase/phosphoenolpyruvate mutase family protein [Acidimicrobiales bacterium]
MTGSTLKATLVEKARLLLDAHHGPNPLVLPNIWDVASARIVAEEGFPIIATSSKAIAGVLGTRDDDSSNPDVIFDFVARIARSVSCPVTADLEAGYGLAPTEFVERLLDAGIVGCNLEDSDHHGGDVLVDSTVQAIFLADVRKAATKLGVHIVINARIDSFIRRVGDEQHQLEEAIRRGLLYLEAGADCVYPIALVDRIRIAQLTTALPGPVNITARRGGLSFFELGALGVRRISFASGIFQLENDHLRVAVHRLSESADPEALWQELSSEI